MTPKCHAKNSVMSERTPHPQSFCMTLHDALDRKILHFLSFPAVFERHEKQPFFIGKTGVKTQSSLEDLISS
jgi:hypothetical protein